MERVRKDYEQMRRALEGREPPSASVAILRAASASPTDAARAAGGFSLAALVAAAASTGSMPTTLRLFAVKADGLYPAAPELEALAAITKALLSHSGGAVQPLEGSYGGGDRTCEAGVECRSGGKAGFQVSWQEGQQQYTVQLEAALSRIALAGPQQQHKVGVDSLSVQPGRTDEQVEVKVQLAAKLPGSGTRVSIEFGGIDLPGWDKRKTKSVSKDRRTLTFEASASQRQQLEALAADLATKAKQATVAVTVAAEAGTGSSSSGEGSSSAAGADAGSSMARTEALMFELQPQAAVVVDPPQLSEAAAAAVKQSLWVKLGAHGQGLAYHLLAANHAASSVEGRLQWLEAQAEATQGQVAVLADDSDARFSVITGAVLEQGASIGDLAQRVSRLEASSSAAQQASGAAGEAHCEDVDMAESESRKRARQSAACSCQPEGAAMHAMALSGPGHRQQLQPQLLPQPPQQQRAEAAPKLTEYSAVAALQWAFMQHSIAEAAAGQHRSCTQAQLLQASSGLGSHLAAYMRLQGLPQPPAGDISGGLVLQPSMQSSMAVLGRAAQVSGAPAISGADAATEQGAATLAMQQATPGGSATAVAASMGVSAAQPGLPAGGPPPGVVPQLQPTSVLQLQPQQLSSMVFQVLMEQWQQGRSAVPARQLASLVCVRSRQAMPLLMALEDPAMPAQQKSAIVRHITTLLYHLSKQPGSWVSRYQQGETVYYGLPASWATRAAAMGVAAAAGGGSGS